MIGLSGASAGERGRRDAEYQCRECVRNGDWRQDEQHQQACHMRQGRRAPHVGHPLEQRIAEQVKRGATDDRRDARTARVLGMHEHQFVRNRANDDAGDDRQLQVRVSTSRDAAGVTGVHEVFGGALHASVEVDPPHRHAADKGRSERDYR